MAKVNKASFKDRLAVSRIMEMALMQITPDKCRYIKDYSDQRIADECDVSIFTVQNVRRELYGNLIRDVSPQRNLEERVRWIEEYLTRQNPGFTLRGD